MNNLVKRNENAFFDLAKKFFNDDFIYFPAFTPTMAADSMKNGGLSNVSEDENGYLIEISAPGLKKDDIKIELENETLKISSVAEEEKEEKTETFHRREFYRTSFERNFLVPKNINKEEISATMSDGILSLTLPKVKEVKSKENIKIDIK
jgi:HSP20 family protein